MTRDEFRESVFDRDENKCVWCRVPGQDAHHIMERRLFEDGGYYLNNGATLCGFCHIRAEQTLISCNDLREKIGIDKPILPSHLYDDVDYDKWANIILPSGLRTKGELFNDESVQKILAPLGLLVEICGDVEEVILIPAEQRGIPFLKAIGKYHATKPKQRTVRRVVKNG